MNETMAFVIDNVAHANTESRYWFYISVVFFFAPFPCPGSTGNIKKSLAVVVLYAFEYGTEMVVGRCAFTTAIIE